MDWKPTPQNVIELGLDRGVVYLPDSPGVPWVGLVDVSETEDASERSALKIDGQKFRRGKFVENFSGTIEAFSYPSELESFFLTPGVTQEFNMCYRVTTLSSFRLHFIYNIRAKISQEPFTANDPAPYTWSFTTRPVPIPYFKPSAHFILDLSRAYPEAISRIEEIIYGDDVILPSLPPITDLLDIFEELSVVRIYDHGDGTWSAEGPDSAVAMIDESAFKIDWPSVVYLSADTYSVHSL